MPNPTSISRRLGSALKHLLADEYEPCLVHLVPALDKTAKRRRPKAGVGERFRSFIDDEDLTISYLGTGLAITGSRFGELTLGGALYKFMRTSIAHEGELDSRLEFVAGNSLTIARDKWTLPVGILHALCTAVILSPENAAEHLDGELGLSLLGTRRNANALWGRKEEILSEIRSRLPPPRA